MRLIYTRFNAKFIFVTFSLLAIVLILAVMFYLSAERFNEHLERSQFAQNVLEDYLTVSNHTYRKLSAVSEIVAQGRVGDKPARIENERLLRSAIKRVRKSIATELAYVRDEDERAELDLLAKIERLGERIIDGSILIRQAVEAGDLGRARQELAILQGESVADQFDKLMDEALKEELREVLQTEAEARALGKAIRQILPISIAMVMIPGLFLTILASRRLTTSIAALDKAARAYRAGDLEHRTELLTEKEFSNLGQAFNQMAQELLSRRKAAEQSQESLEALVRARTQELESANSQLETLDRSRRQLLADISHELRTPLTVIQGESEMALRGDPKSAEEYCDALSRVREQTLHTARLVDDLLFVARVEDGKARIEKQSVEIVDVMRSVCRDFQSVAEKKHITIVESYTDKQVVVFGDKGRLRQVLTILLDNAIRYSHRNGKVTADLSLSTQGDIVILTISDQGIGLTEQEASQAFYRFYRGNNAERHAQGTGLGLPVAKAIVEAHNGKIMLVGKPGEYTQAVVRLLIDN